LLLLLLLTAIGFSPGGSEWQPGCSRDDNVKFDLKEIGCEDIEWIEVQWVGSRILSEGKTFRYQLSHSQERLYFTYTT
jgi:hypothetical protein